MNHTPGPWILDREYFLINHPPQTENPNECCLIASYGRKADGSHEANARLIAAAPELLEAAKQVIWKLSHNHQTGTYTGPAQITRLDATVRMLEEAVSKAEARRN